MRIPDRYIDKDTTDIDEAIEITLRLLSALNEVHLSVSYPSFLPYTFGHDQGRKYSRIWVDNGTQRFVSFFVQRDNGDVWKADGWKKPALNFTRGNIMGAENRRDFLLSRLNKETGYFYHGIA